MVTGSGHWPAHRLRHKLYPMRTCRVVKYPERLMSCFATATPIGLCHFVSSHSAAERVARLGEPKGRYVIGSPELDFHSKPLACRLKWCAITITSRFLITGLHLSSCHIGTGHNGKQAANLFGALDALAKFCCDFTQQRSGFRRHYGGNPQTTRIAFGFYHPCGFPIF